MKKNLKFILAFNINELELPSIQVYILIITHAPLNNIYLQ